MSQVLYVESLEAEATAMHCTDCCDDEGECESDHRCFYVGIDEITAHQQPAHQQVVWLRREIA